MRGCAGKPASHASETRADPQFIGCKLFQTPALDATGRWLSISQSSGERPRRVIDRHDGIAIRWLKKMKVSQASQMAIAYWTLHN